MGLRPDQVALEKIKLLSVPGIEPQFLDSPVHNIITILISIARTICNITKYDASLDYTMIIL